MADLSRSSKNDQKKEISIFATDIMDTNANTFGNLPKDSLVTGVFVVVSKVDPTASSTIDVKIGSTIIANEVPVAALATVTPTVAPLYFPTGGQISVVKGAVPGAGTGKIKVIIQFIETELTDGSYLY